MARSIGARLISGDHLTAFVCVFSVPGDQDPRTLIEAVEQGWWYTGALDGDTRIVAFMTDAGIGRDPDLARVEGWLERLRETRYVARTVGAALPLRGPLVRPAGSQHLEPVCAEDWLAVGDAAMALDPLSGQGIVAALRAGIFAAYAIGDWLSGSDPCALLHYRRFMQGVLTNYRRARAQYYAGEQRWPSHPFWSRRSTA